MKKLTATLLAMLMMLSMVLVGCNKEEEKEEGPKDYSEFAFVDVSWKREGDHDLETIRFGADGSFTYSCACGNAVGDYDLCDEYTYDDKTKTITLNCLEEVEDMVTVIKVVKCEGDELQLDFDGEILVFGK